MSEPVPDNPESSDDASTAAEEQPLQPISAESAAGVAIESGDAGAATQASAVAHPSPSDPMEGLLSDLPMYARGLLKIRVPIRVTLASQRKSIQEIIELGPGSIVKFDKTCEQPLELTVGDRTIAMGEVVKVGDKFGLRIGELLTP
jgi:flagellar motor switch protein FliN